MSNLFNSKVCSLNEYIIQRYSNYKKITGFSPPLYNMYKNLYFEKLNVQ